MWLSKNTVLIALVMTYGYQADTMMDEEPELDEENNLTDESASEDLNVFLKVEPPENFKLIIPEECHETGICEHVPSYPQEYVSNIITLLAKKNIKLNTDVDPWEDVTTDVDGNEKEEDLCQSDGRVYYPQAGRDKNNTWHLILNSKQIPQNIRGRVCRSHPNTKSTSCSHIRQFSNNHYGKCAPEYVTKVMVCLELLTGEVKSCPIDVPVCCVCKVVN